MLSDPQITLLSRELSQHGVKFPGPFKRIEFITPPHMCITDKNLWHGMAAGRPINHHRTLVRVSANINFVKGLSLFGQQQFRIHTIRAHHLGINCYFRHHLYFYLGPALSPDRVTHLRLICGFPSAISIAVSPAPSNLPGSANPGNGQNLDPRCPMTFENTGTCLYRRPGGINIIDQNNDLTPHPVGSPV